MDFYYKNLFYGLSMYSSYQYQAPQIRMLAIKIPTKEQEKIIVDLVENIILLRNQNQEFNSSTVETEIDNLVYHLYDLTHDEVLIVDPNFSVSKEEYESFTW